MKTSPEMMSGRVLPRWCRSSLASLSLRAKRRPSWETPKRSPLFKKLPESTSEIGLRETPRKQKMSFEKRYKPQLLELQPGKRGNKPGAKACWSPGECPAS